MVLVPTASVLKCRSNSERPGSISDRIGMKPVSYPGHPSRVASVSIIVSVESRNS
jgi:hypothetical protein